MMEETVDKDAQDVMMRLQVITGLQQLASPAYPPAVEDPDRAMYAAAAKKALRSFQAAHPRFFSQ